MNSLKVGVIMDPIEKIKPQKDSSFALMLEAQARGMELYYMEMQDIALLNGRAVADMRPLQLSDSSDSYYALGESQREHLASLDILLMRKDPPFDIEYIMATYILERAEAEGCLVVNRAQSLRDANEKVFTSWFKDCCPPSLLSRSRASILEFLTQHEKIVLKPTDKMGGQSIFIVEKGDVNTNIIIEEMTRFGQRFIQAQKYIPEIETTGDKRVILFNGKAIEQAITRLPGEGDHRGNMAVGARAEAYALDARDKDICKTVGPVLMEKGIYFAGIDIIGGYMTEVNVTSPTGIREIDRFYKLNISAVFWDGISGFLSSK